MDTERKQEIKKFFSIEEKSSSDGAEVIFKSELWTQAVRQNRKEMTQIP